MLKSKNIVSYFFWLVHEKIQFSWEPWNLVNALDEGKSNELINLYTNTAISVFMVGTLKVEMGEKKTLTRQIVCERHNAITWQIESIICKVDLN